MPNGERDRMFWDGSRWVDETPRQPLPAPRSAVARLGCHALIGFALVALIIPNIATFASNTSSGRSLIAAWSTSYRRSDVTPGIEPGPDRLQRPLVAPPTTRLLRWLRPLRAREGREGFTMTFSGTAVAWIGPVGPTRGNARLYLDGKYVKTVSTFSRSFKAARVLFKVRWKHPGTHRITISVAGTHGHPTVAIDLLVVRTSTSAGARAGDQAQVRHRHAEAGDKRTSPRARPRSCSRTTMGRPERSTTLSLSGFAGGSTGAIDFDGSTNGMPSYTTASNGTAKVTLTVPGDAGVGAHDINTRGPNGDSLMTRTFEVTGPAPIRRPADPPAADPTPTPHAGSGRPACGRSDADTNAGSGRPACGRSDAVSRLHAGPPDTRSPDTRSDTCADTRADTRTGNRSDLCGRLRWRCDRCHGCHRRPQDVPAVPQRPTGRTGRRTASTRSRTWRSRPAI